MTILVLVFIVTFLLGVPVAFTLGLAGLATLTLDMGKQLTVAVSRMYASMDSFPLLAIPLFVIMGQLLDKSDALSRLSDFLCALLRPIKGGLAHVNVLLSMLFAGVSGTALADIASLGYLEIKMMNEAGYDRDFAAAVTAASSIEGPIIPPSVGMILFVIAIGGGVSISGIFMAGLLPGIVMGVGMIIVNLFVIKARHMDKRIIRGEKLPTGELVKLGLKSWPMLLLPVIILGGIMTGVFTVTESATIGVFYALVVGFFVTKKLKLSDIPGCLIGAAITTGTVAMLFAAGSLVSWILTVNQIPAMLARMITTYISSPYVFMLFVTVFLAILGCFMDATAAIIMMAPILYPIATSFGINTFTFGVLFTMVMMIGMITPPVGVALFVTSSVAEVPIKSLIRMITPYVIEQFLVVLILIVFPPFTTWLPTVLGFA